MLQQDPTSTTSKFSRQIVLQRPNEPIHQQFKCQREAFQTVAKPCIRTTTVSSKKIVVLTNYVLKTQIITIENIVKPNDIQYRKLYALMCM